MACFFVLPASKDDYNQILVLKVELVLKWCVLGGWNPLLVEGFYFHLFIVKGSSGNFPQFFFFLN